MLVAFGLGKARDALARLQAVAALSAGAAIPRAMWAARWQARRFAKHALGDIYLRLRGEWLGASEDVRWGDELTSRSKDPA